MFASFISFVKNYNFAKLYKEQLFIVLITVFACIMAIICIVGIVKNNTTVFGARTLFSQKKASTDNISSFQEKIRFTDFALHQAALATQVRPEKIHTTIQEKEVPKLGLYSFQTIAILATPSFPFALIESLQTWNTGAAIQRIDDNTFRISIDTILTHEIILFADTNSFSTYTKEHSTNDFSAPFIMSHNPENPQIVIVLDDLGENQRALNRLLHLNFPVTCAFWPFASFTHQGATKAHQSGRDVIVHMPMEPVGYPQVKPGPNALYMNMLEDEIRNHVIAAVAKVPYAMGLNNHMGSRFTQDTEKIATVLSVLQEKNLLALDSVTHPRTIFFNEAQKYNIPRFQRSVFIDVESSHKAVLEALKKTERIARNTGFGIAIGHPLPHTLSALEEWQHTRDKSITIVRFSDLLSQQKNSLKATL